MERKSKRGRTSVSDVTENVLSDLGACFGLYVLRPPRAIDDDNVAGFAVAAKPAAAAPASGSQGTGAAIASA